MPLQRVRSPVCRVKREEDDVPFEVFTKRMAPLRKKPSVTIQKRGLFSINRAAHALMGEPKTVELLFDRENQIVGIRAVDGDTPHAYVLRPQSPAKDTGPLIIAGGLFTQFYGIDTTVSRRWIPSFEDDILGVNLRTEGVIATSNRGRRPSDQGD